MRSGLRSVVGVVAVAGVAVAAVTVGPAAPAGAATPRAAALVGPARGYSWGANDHFQLGGMGGPKSTPSPVENLLPDTVRQVSAGLAFSAALLSDGTVDTWGDNTVGQLGRDAPQEAAFPVEGLTGVTQISAGFKYTLALTADGTVRSWGYNALGQLGDGTRTTQPKTVPVQGLTNVVQVAAGEFHSLALRSDGTVWAWGDNSSSQLGDGTTTVHLTPVQVHNLTGVVQIATGRYHSMALRSDGTVWVWGANNAGQLGLGNASATQALPVQVPGLTGVTKIAAGWQLSMAVAGANSSVWAWGDDTRGALGDGASVLERSPVQIGLNGVSQLAIGQWSAAAVRSDNTLWTWGDNTSHQLGTGSTAVFSSVPVQVQVPGLPNVAQVAVGGTHDLAIVALPPCAAGQLMANPGFESGAASWTATSGVIGPYTGLQAPHTGSWDAWLDGYGTTHTDSVFQFVSIPEGCTHATLSFWLHITTAETASVPNDQLVISADEHGTLATFSNLDASSGYRFISFSLSTLGGEAMGFSFGGTENASLQTSFLVDDVAVDVS